jgi:hypothetical protein
MFLVGRRGFGQPKVLAALVGGVHFLHQLDQFLKDLLRGDRTVVIGVERLLEFFTEPLGLDQVAAQRAKAFDRSLTTCTNRFLPLSC